METLLEKFMRFEEKQNLFFETFEGFRYWPYLRFSIYKRLEEINNNQEKEKEHFPLSLSKLVSIVKNCTINNPLLYKQHKDVLFISHARRIKIDGLFRCIYTDKIAEDFAENGQTAEFIYGFGHLKPAYTKHLLDLDYVDFWPAVQFPIYKFFRKEIVEKIYEQADKITELLNETFKIQITQDFIRDLFLKRFYWYKKKKKILRKILINIQPKVIVEVVGYEVNKLIINELASELGIETIELQHGVIGRGHLAYNYLVDRRYDFLPKNICMFSDYWVNTCSFPINPKNKIVTGFPYLEEQMRLYPPESNRTSTIKILIISQPEFSEKLRKIMEQLLNILGDNDTKFLFLYKLHPVEYNVPQDKWNDLKAYKNFILINEPDIPLYSLFAQADIQVGVTSTAIFEGLAYGLKTYICHFEKTDIYMGDLCRLGFAEMVDSPEELLEKLEGFTRVVSPQDVINPFFVQNAKEKIEEEIQKRCNNAER